MGNYHQLYYHVTWATYERQPMIDGKLRQPLHDYLKGKTIAMGGIAFAVNNNCNKSNTISNWRIFFGPVNLGIL